MKTANLYNFKIRRFLVNLFNKVCVSRKIEEKSAVFISNPDFADNIYPIFIELQKRGYKCLWVLNYKYSKKNAKQHKVKFIILKKSLRNMFVLSKYKFFFYSHHMPYMYKKDGQIVYDCWHGSPFKVYHGVLMNNYADGYYFLPPSKDALMKYHEMYPDQIDVNKSLPYRHFRTDYFIDDFSKTEHARVQKIFQLSLYKKVALCCLTWIRDSEENKKTNNLLGLDLKHDDFLRLNEFLRNDNILLLVKPHPGQKIIDDMVYSNIIFISSHELSKKSVQLYSLICQCDILFTDYSSILFDYCLLEKPVGHIIHDWEYFTNNEHEQFIYKDPQELMYGTKIHNLEELIDFLKNPKENNNELRKKINIKYNDDPYLNESSTLRFIKEVLHEEI